jgi:5'-nucleotidase
LVKKLLSFNTDDEKWVEVVILSRNDPVSGMRVFHSAKQAGLGLQRGVFTRGRTPFRYLEPLGAQLFLSANEGDVRQALEAGFPAARVFSQSLIDADRHPDELRIAFDGDAVLFDDEAERVFQRDGLNAFQSHEQRHARRPLPPGPFKPLLEALQRLQQRATSNSGNPGNTGMRIRTALVTARSAPAHERAIRTLMDWNITIDEAMFLGGLDKGIFLREFEPDFFFDDQTRHCESGSMAGPTGLVVSGVTHQS